MDYKTNWKDFLKYNGHGRRVHDFPAYLVDTAPGEQNYMYRGEYEAMIAAEKAVKDAHRAARQAELAASRPNSVNSAVTGPNAGSDAAQRAAVFAGRRGDPRVPDLERHSRKCLICSHPDRDAIEGEFIRWRSPHKIARDYNVTDRASIYRHAHATNLFEERRRQIARVLESFLETIDDNPPADFDPVTRAVRVYAHLNANGAWFEPLRKVHITTSHAPWPNRDLDLDPDDSDPDDDDPRGESIVEPPEIIESRRDDTYVARHVSAGNASGLEPRTFDPELRERPSRASDKEFRFAEGGTSTEERSLGGRTFASGASQAPAETKERVGQAFRPDSRSDEARECWEPERREPPTSGAVSSAALHVGDAEEASHGSLPTESSAATKEFRCAEGNSSRHGGQATEVAASGRETVTNANRNNPKIQNLHNQHQANEIPKLNRNKNAVSASPGFRRAQ
jgi:hypothetical protein